MEVNAGTLIALQKSYNAIFLDMFDVAVPQWSKVAMRVPSTAKSETYNWLGRVPMLREWVADKKIDLMQGFDYTVKNRDWEATIEVDRNDIEDDALGLYRPMVGDLGRRAKFHPDSLLSALRANGAVDLCYDGQFFYDTDHAEGASGTLSNIITGTGTTVASLKADFDSAIARMRGFKDNQGEPYIIDSGSQLNVLVTIPPAMEGPMRDLRGAQLLSNTSNTLMNAFDYQIDARLIGNDWYMDYMGGQIKPFIYQDRRPAQFVSQDTSASEPVFMRKKFRFGVEGRYTMAYGMWQYSVKIDN